MDNSTASGSADQTTSNIPISTATEMQTSSESREPATHDGAESTEVSAEQEESDLDDIFDDDDDDDRDEFGQISPDSESDLTRNFNRQQPLNSNRQKPSANTMANVDDQISALSRHAAKIRLDDVKEGQDRDKDKSDRATAEQVLDPRTRMILYQMINRGVVSEVHGAISTGKEANVYGAVSYPDIHGSGSPVQRAVKVYKTAILSFKDRERYIAGEHRFKMGADKGNNRKMVKLWAEKEFRNLRRIYTAGIACPEPIQLKLHVLVMSFLGDRRGWAYPRLRDAAIPTDEAEQIWSHLYLQLLGIMRRMYQVCRLVHADLSEYNILYNDRQLYIIDVSQSVEHDHPRSLEFLRMDIKNTGDFFRRQGVDTLSDRTIFDFIISSEGAVQEPELSKAVENLYAAKSASANDEEATAQQEVDNEVFRNQYIPQTLDQVYDIEKDAEKIGEGEADKLVYRNLLADQVVRKENGVEQQSSDDQSDDGATLDSDDNSDEDGENKFSKGTPRGKRFEDKEEKRQRKHAVKEAKSEKRKEKMPKHMKKRLVATTSRKKK
ncbi:RIO1 family-domain-containing protein [Xylariomycetidae sp. FL2044]|nr:RIO1 family-domain-containing protein [Xylariomycetidae sp. FL2044]